MAYPLVSLPTAWRPLLLAEQLPPDSGGQLPPANLESHADWEWAAGILLCLCGAATTNLGLTLQKRSFLDNDARSPGKQQPATKQPLWIGGLMVFLVGQLLNLLAFGFTSQAVAATLGSFSLVTNGVFAPLLLRERLTKQIVLSIGVIVAGSVAVVLSSSRAPQEYALHELMHLLRRPLFVSYLSVLVLAFALSQLLMWREDRVWKAAHREADEWEAAEAEAGQKQRNNDDEEQQRAAVSSPVRVRVLPASPDSWNAPETSDRLTEHAPLLVKVSPRSPVRSPSSSPASSTSSMTSPSGGPSRPAPLSSITPIVAGAVLSSCSVLFGKCSVQLLKASMQGENQFTDPLSWVLTLVFVVCAVAAVGFLNIGLRRGTALFVVPLYFVLNTVLAIVGGLIYFEEFRRFSVAQGALFSLGVAATVLGVFMSSRGQVQVEDGGVDEDEDVEEEDEALVDTEAEAEEELESSPSAASAEKPIVSPISVDKIDEAGESDASTAEQLSSSPEPPAPLASSLPVPASRPALKPARRTLSPSSSCAAALAEADARAKRKLSLSVHFDEECMFPGGQQRGVAAASRLTRTVSEPSKEAAAAAVTAHDEQEEAHARMHAGVSVSPTLRRHPALSTPQPHKRYGSMASALAASEHAFRTPGPSPASSRRLDAGAAGAAVSAAGSKKSVRRARSMSALSGSDGQSSATSLRDQQLQVASWRRSHAAHKRYSLDHLAFQSSFRQNNQTQVTRASEERRPPPPFERRYSVAVLGLGIS